MKERVFFEEFESLYYFHGSTQNWAMQGFHFHNQYEIILFLNDGALLEIGDRVYHVMKGDLFFINNREYHRTSGAEGKEYNRYVLMFEPELLEPMTKAFGYDFTMFFENRGDDFVHRLYLEGENLKRVERLLAKIETNIGSGSSEEASVKIRLSILELITAINEMYKFFMKEKHTAADSEEQKWKEEDGKFRDPILYRERVEQIKKYITAHVEEKLDLDEIAGKFYMNRYFKKETGFTVLQYVTNQKIIAAKALLKKGTSVTDVALKLSYNSDSHFISVFKKNTGITPKKYAQNKKNNNV